MPGMMDTVLNIGLNDKVVAAIANLTGNERFAYDSYRRLINMFGDTVMGVDHEHFEHELSAVKRDKGVQLDTDLDTEGLKEVVSRYKKVYEQHVGSPFPEDPMLQLEHAIEAVFKSWMGDRAISYRQINDIRGLAGTAVNVQTMVFGNMGEDSRHRRRVHPQPQHRREQILRRIPRQRPGRRRRRRHPHACSTAPPSLASGRRKAGRNCSRSRTCSKHATRTCRISSSPSKRERCTCCRPAAASATPWRR